MELKALLFSFILLTAISTKMISQGYDAEVIKYSVLCEVEKDKLVQTDSVTIQINNRAGDQYTSISIPYSKTEKVSNLDAWIEDVNGHKIRILNKNEVVDKSAISEISLYEDHYCKNFQLKHNSYPYRINYTYKTSCKNFITIAWWSPIIYTKIPTKTADLKIILPKDLQIIKSLNSISCSGIDSSGKKNILMWKASYDQPIKEEIYSQPENSKPYVIIAPLNFTYGVPGSISNWKSYGNWQYRLIQELDILPDEEKMIISSLIKGISDKREIIKILYHYLQDHTRYINVSIGIGGLKPYPASYVAANKYGDCKALTNYLKAMLKFAGIESYYLNVYADEQPHDIIKSFPGPQFNHALLAVPVNNDTIWLESTVNINPFGYIGTFTQNREALLIDKSTSKIVKMPALKKENNHSSYTVEYDLKLNGFAKATIKSSFTGLNFERFNQLNSDFNDDEKDKIIKEYMPFDNYEVINWELKKLHRDSARIELDATLNLSKLLKPLGKEFYFSLYPIKLPSFSEPAGRSLPLVIPYPIFNSDTLLYHLPKGYRLKNYAEPVSIKTKFGNYHLSCQFTDDAIYFTKSVELFSGTYPLEEYPSFIDFIHSVKDVDYRNIIIQSIN